MPSRNTRNESYEAAYRHAAGRVLHRIRSERGWSYREFGEKAGTSHTNLYAIERGEATPGIDVLGRVAAAAGLDLATILHLIADEVDETPGLIAQALGELQSLGPEERDEAIHFMQYLAYRRSRSD
ncbi:MAG: helix-turn-helix domain-containing protein [Chloroflexota bacterium]